MLLTPCLWIVLTIQPSTAPAEIISVERQAPTVEYVTIDRTHRAASQPISHDGEDAWCQSLFNCSVKLKYEIIRRSSDAAGLVTVDAQVKRQIGQAERQDDRVGRPHERDQGHAGERHRDDGAGGKQHAHDTRIARASETKRADREPRGDDANDACQRGSGHAGIPARLDSTYLTRMPGAAPESGVSR